MKVRWRSLRDAYVKERKYDLALTSGVKMKPKKPWRFKMQIEFLAPFIQLRKDLSTSTEARTESRMRSVDAKTSSKTIVTDSSLKTVGENGSSSNYEINLFNQCIPKSNDQRFIEIDSFFRDIANAVKGLNRNSQFSLQKEITNLVMNYKLKELEGEEKEQNERIIKRDNFGNSSDFPPKVDEMKERS